MAFYYWTTNLGQDRLEVKGNNTKKKKKKEFDEKLNSKDAYCVEKRNIGENSSN